MTPEWVCNTSCVARFDLCVIPHRMYRSSLDWKARLLTAKTAWDRGLSVTAIAFAPLRSGHSPFRTSSISKLIDAGCYE